MINTFHRRRVLGKPVFKFTVKTDNIGTSNNDQFTLPIYQSGSSNFDIKTSDGQEIIGATGTTTITFPASGTYTIELEGDVRGILFNNGGDKEKLMVIKSWGLIEWKSFVGAFFGCENLTITAADIPILLDITTFVNTFNECSSLTDIPNVGLWNTSNITSIGLMFNRCTNFNADIGGWDMSSLVGAGLKDAFFNCQKFNADLSSWSTGVLTNMESAFENCFLFNSDLLGFDVSGVSNMLKTFEDATIFNGDISNWDVSNVSNFNNFLYKAKAFNQDIGGWSIRTSGNVSMTNMLRTTTVFNQDIGGWDVSKVTSFSLFLFQNNVFDQDLSSWQPISCTTAFQYSGAVSVYWEDILTAWNLLPLVDLAPIISEFNKCLYDPQNVESGNVSSIVPFKLVDLSKSFLGVVNVGDIVRNTTTHSNEAYEWKYAKVDSVDSNTELTLSHDIMIVTTTVSANLRSNYNIETAPFSHVRENLVNVKGWRINDGNVI